jgi:hypothetical protein
MRNLEPFSFFKEENKVKSIKPYHIFESKHSFRAQEFHLRDIEGEILNIFLDLTDKEEMEVRIEYRVSSLTHRTFAIITIADHSGMAINDEELKNSLLTLKSYLESEDIKIDEIIADVSGIGNIIDSRGDVSDEFIQGINEPVYWLEIEYSFK